MQRNIDFIRRNYQVKWKRNTQINGIKRHNFAGKKNWARKFVHSERPTPDFSKVKHHRVDQPHFYSRADELEQATSLRRSGVLLHDGRKPIQIKSSEVGIKYPCHSCNNISLLTAGHRGL